MNFRSARDSPTLVTAAFRLPRPCRGGGRFYFPFIPQRKPRKSAEFNTVFSSKQLSGPNSHLSPFKRALIPPGDFLRLPSQK